MIDDLIAAFAPAEGAPHRRADLRDGKRGNPVLWSRAFFPELQDVTGDVGARGLLGAHGEGVVEVAVSDDAAFLDVDTPEALDEARAASTR